MRCTGCWKVRHIYRCSSNARVCTIEEFVGNRVIVRRPFLSVHIYMYYGPGTYCDCFSGMLERMP